MAVTPSLAQTPHSLVQRLYLRISVVVVAGFALFVAAMLVDFSFEAIEIERRSLLGLADRVAADPDQFAIGVDSADGRQPIDGVTLRRPSGELLVRPDRWAVDTIPEFPFIYGKHEPQIGRDSRTGEQLFAVSVTLDGALVGYPGEPIVLQIARPTSDFEPIITTFFRATLDGMWWIFALILVVTLAVVRFTVHRSMRAVRLASEQAAAIAPDEIDRRLPLAGLPAEIEPLARRVNDALDRLEQGYRAERSFTASAAHELRTPLSVLRTRIELLSPDAERDKALAQLDDMARLIGQLLQLTRVETWRANAEDLADMVDVCRRVASDLSPAIVENSGDIELIAPNAPCGWTVDRILVEIVLRNLIENAMRHSDGPPVVRITVAATALVVEDAGPGIPEENRSRVFDVFWRKRDGRNGGAGIGLALVSRIAARMGGSVRIDSSNLGGAAVTLSRGAA